MTNAATAQASRLRRLLPMIEAMPSASGPSAASTRVRTTCPRDCYDTCGIEARVQDGRIVRVSGDPEHPVSRGTLCGKCATAYNGVWLDAAARLTQPLVRTGPKGSGSFAEASWDEALAVIAAKLGPLATSGQGAKIVHSHYTGTNSVIAGSFGRRFFDRLGATEVEPDTICNNAAHSVLALMTGDSMHGFDPRDPEAECLVVWGANPSAAAPHAHRHWIPEFDGTTVVVDPIAHPTAKIADIHLQVRPGADAALAFALLKAASATGDGLALDFLNERCDGWDLIAPMVEGLDLGALAAQTGIAVGDINAVAELLAEKRTLIWLGQGLQRQLRGGAIYRACVTLAAATGNMGRPGTGVLFLNGGRHIDPGIAGGGDAPHSISHMDLIEVLADRERCEALVTWNNNLAASNPRQSELRAALAQEDLFTVVVDVFGTDTADYADVVLPAASFLEFDDLVVSYFHCSVSAQVKVADPPGAALPNQEIFRRLAQAMGFDEPELHVSDAELIDEMLARSDTGIGFAELAAKGTIWPDSQAQTAFCDGRFATPNGRLQLAGDAFADSGLPAVPSAEADDAPEPGTFRLLSPADPLTMNSSYSNDPRIERRLGALTVTLNPADAAELGLAAGDTVEVASDVDAIEAQVAVSDDVGRQVALCPKGRWPKRSGQGANVNAITGTARTDIGDSSAIHSTRVTIRPA